MGYRNIPLIIRQEYGDSLSEVIRGYARMGYSMTATAQAMEIKDHRAFAGWVDRLGLRGCFDPTRYNDSCRPKGKGRKPGNIKYTDDELLAYVRAHGMSSYLYQKERSPGEPTHVTICGRFGSWNNAKRKAKEIMGNGLDER